MTQNISPQSCDQQQCAASRENAIRCFVYALCDEHGVRYVGRSRDPFARFTHHASEHATVRIRTWLSGLYASGKKPTLRILSRCSHEEAPAVEAAFIAAHSSPLLLNVQSRGKASAKTVRFDDEAFALMGTRIRRRRQRLGIDQLTLEKASGVAHGVLSRIESGHRQGAAGFTLYRIAKALDTTVEWLLDGRGEP